VERLYIDDLSAGASMVVTTASGSSYTFTLSGPRYGTLAGGRLDEPTLALFLGSQPAGEVGVRPGSIEVGHHARFLCPLVGEIVTTPVTDIVLEDQHVTYS
jgi:hypothetical protein